MNYRIEHRVETLSNNAVMEEDSSPSSFSVLDIKFSHWDFNFHDGWQQNYWLAEGKEEAKNVVDAINQFRKKLENIVPKISLVGQCYVDYLLEPWLVQKEGSDVFLYRHIKNVEGGGLMLLENEKKPWKYC